MSIFPQSGARGLERYPFVKYYNVEKWKSRYFGVWYCQKYTLHKKKKGSNKCFSELNFIWKCPRAHMSISPQNGAEGLERYPYYNVENGKVDSLWGSTLPKIRIASKKSSYKCYSELNFVRKGLQAHVSISIWGSTLPKIRIASKKCSNKCCSKLNFVQKCSRAHVSICPRVELGGLKDWYSWNIMLYWNGKL